MDPAFTLLELLVVMAVIGILTVMSLALLSGKRGTEISMAGGVVSDLANLARQNALAKNTRTVLVLAQVNDGGALRSAVSIWDAANTNQLEKWNLLPESVVATNASGFSPPLTLPCAFRGQTITNGDYFVFYPDGHMSEDQTQVAKLAIQPRQGNQGDFYKLVFNPLTGTSKVSRP
ncbi:hypothetical protein BH09VER1_BH09VER1_23170 [soil metagenome]